MLMCITAWKRKKNQNINKRGEGEAGGVQNAQ